MPLAGRGADVKITSPVPTSSTAETFSYSTATLTGLIDDLSKRHIDPDSPFDLYLNSTIVPSSQYVVNHVQGTFRWLNSTAPPSDTGPWEADMYYLTAATVALGREWTLNTEADMFEVSTFGSSGWKEFMPNLNGSQVTINRYWDDGDFLDHMVNDSRFIVELIPSNVGSTSARYEGFARVASDQVQTGVDAIVSESINLTIDGRLYYTT